MKVSMNDSSHIEMPSLAIGESVTEVGVGVDALLLTCPWWDGHAGWNPILLIPQVLACIAHPNGSVATYKASVQQTSLMRFANLPR